MMFLGCFGVFEVVTSGFGFGVLLLVLLNQ